MVVLATSVAVLAIANVALAEHRGGRISACYDRTSGAVRLIKQGRLPTRCPHGTTAFTFAVRGPQGAPGATGPAGVDGDPGAQGPAGPAGAPGGDGRTILHGSGAPSNASGSDGDFYLDDAAYVLYGPKSGGAWPASGIGLIGADGARGPAGAAGPAGADGADGADGGAGPVGPIGPAGPPGGAGPAGADGLDGLDGATGAIGPEGAAGATGPAGPAGDDGSDGAEGATGPVGAAGPTGPAGPAGPVGPAGQAGADGADGADGATGPSGAAGTDGIDGLDGATGPAGPDGSDGSDGSDGNTILSGSGAPAGSAGVAGDFYLDTGSWTLYGPKASGAWPGSGTSLVGPAGPGEDPVWIQVSDATAQSVAVANTLQNLTWSTNGATDGFVHVPGTAQVLAPRSGVYQLTASIPMQRTGVISPMSTATACLAVNGANVVCQSAGFGSSDLKQGVPLTSIVQLAAGDVITLRFKGTSTSLQVAGSTDSMSVMTIASVD